MANKDEENNTPKRGPGSGRGPGMMGRGPGEKAKNFKSAIKRLFKELKNFRFLIGIALILAALGSILSISAPNKLSELTDEISSGLVVNSDNMQELSDKIKDNMSKDDLFTESEIDGNTVTTQDQIEFLRIIYFFSGM